jgi:hypothetical protein
MESNCREKSLTFGEFITRVYDVWDPHKARGIVRLAVNARLLEFQGHDRFVILWPASDKNFHAHE